MQENEYFNHIFIGIGMVKTADKLKIAVRVQRWAPVEIKCYMRDEVISGFWR